MSVSPPPPACGSLIPPLPDDLSIHCIALLPREDYAALSQVSRPFRFLLRRSPEPLLAARRRHHLSNPHLLLSLRPPAESSPLWFLLPYPGHPPFPLPPPPLAVSSSAAAAAGSGGRLFLVGGSISGVPSTAVQIFDPVAKSWSAGPRLSSAREYPAVAAARGGRLLVAAGGCLPCSASWAEALDLSSPTAKWSPLPSPEDLREKWMHGCVVLAGRFLAVADRGGVAYDPTVPPDEAWTAVSPVLDMGWKGRAAVVDGILYSYDYLGQVKGYDPDADAWSTVEGLEKELPRFLCGATLADLGGLLCLVWEGNAKGKKGKGSSGVVIHWAGIEVTRASGGRLRGKVVWMDSLLFAGAPRGSSIAHCVALEL